MDNGTVVVAGQESMVFHLAQVRKAHRRMPVDQRDVSSSVQVGMLCDGLLNQERAALLDEGGDTAVLPRILASQLACDGDGKIEEAVGDPFKGSMLNGPREWRRLARVKILLEILQVIDELEQYSVTEDRFRLGAAEPPGKQSVNENGGASFFDREWDERVFGAA